MPPVPGTNPVILFFYCDFIIHGFYTSMVAEPATFL
jgi:hypothetical protein